MRITHIDGFRGFFLVSMTIGHLSFLTPSVLGRLTHHTLGFVDAAQGFVAFSGLVIGLVYGKRLLRRSEAEMRVALRTRMRTLWLWTAGLTLLVAAIVPYLPHIPGFLSANLGDAPWLAASLGLGLFSGVWGVEVLAAYLVFMALTPMALVAMQRGRWAAIALISMLAWLLGQSSLPDTILATLSQWAGLEKHGLAFGLYFNRLGWQVLYFAGLALGFLMAQDRLRTEFLYSHAGRVLLLPSLVLIALFYLGSLLVTKGTGPLSPGLQVFIAAFDREDMTLLRIAVFGAYIYVGLWLLVCGGTVRFNSVQALSRGLHALGTWRPLVFLGQHSLQVFAWQAILVYLFAAFVAPPLKGLPLPLHEFAVGLAAVSLWIPAALHARYRQAGRPLLVLPFVNRPARSQPR